MEGTSLDLLLLLLLLKVLKTDPSQYLVLTAGLIPVGSGSLCSLARRILPGQCEVYSRGHYYVVHSLRLTDRQCNSPLACHCDRVYPTSKNSWYSKERDMDSRSHTSLLKF